MKTITPLNTDLNGNCSCIKANYYKMGYENFLSHTKDGFKATCIMEILTDYIKVQKPKEFENVKEVYQSHTLNEILPYLPNEDCFFDSRHWVCGLTKDILPFSVTTRISENSQQFLKTMNIIEKDNLVDEPLRIPQATKQGYIEVQPGSLFDASYPASKTRRGRVQDGGQTSPTLMAAGEAPCYYENKPSYRIRKLTPKECFRLMGVSDENIKKIQDSGISNAQQYKMAGNSIVVDVLEHIFRKMFVDKGQESKQLMLF